MTIVYVCVLRKSFYKFCLSNVRFPGNWIIKLTLLVLFIPAPEKSSGCQLLSRFCSVIWSFPKIFGSSYFIACSTCFSLLNLVYVFYFKKASELKVIFSQFLCRKIFVVEAVLLRDGRKLVIHLVLKFTDFTEIKDWSCPGLDALYRLIGLHCLLCSVLHLPPSN